MFYKARIARCSRWLSIVRCVTPAWSICMFARISRLTCQLEAAIANLGWPLCAFCAFPSPAFQCYACGAPQPFCSMCHVFQTYLEPRRNFNCVAVGCWAGPSARSLNGAFGQQETSQKTRNNPTRNTKGFQEHQNHPQEPRKSSKTCTVPQDKRARDLTVKRNRGSFSTRAQAPPTLNPQPTSTDPTAINAQSILPLVRCRRASDSATQRQQPTDRRTMIYRLFQCPSLGQLRAPWAQLVILSQRLLAFV